LAIGDIWIWLIAVVWGWFRVGTHHGRRKHVVEILQEKAKTIQLSNKTMAEEGDYGLRIRRSHNAIHRAGTIEIRRQWDDSSNSVKGQKDSGSIFPVGGDELLDGPFYNYARCGTWMYLANTLIQAYDNVLATEKMRSSRRMSSIYRPPTPSNLEERDGYLVAERSTSYARGSVSSLTLTRPTSIVYTEGTINVDASSISNFEDDNRRLLPPEPQVSYLPESVNLQYGDAIKDCKFSHSGPLPPFGWKRNPRLEKLRTHIWVNKVTAFAIAVVLQGMTGWSAFMLTYNTPTIGIGCRSFVFMLYTLLSPFCCILFILGSHFSELECYRRELATDSGSKANGFIGTVGVCCRVLAKLLAILNACLIIISTIFEFSGVYNNCFCKSSYIGLGKRAYISFYSQQEAAAIALPYWIAGAGTPIFAIICVSIGYFELTRDK
jgi:hypothetical protein